MVKIFNREQAVWLGLVAAAAQVLLAFGLDVTSTVQAWVTAAIVFVFAVVTAVRSGDGVVALVTGVGVALFQLLAVFGLHWTADRQQALLAALTVIASFFVRQNVAAPAGPEVSPPGKLVA